MYIQVVNAMPCSTVGYLVFQTETIMKTSVKKMSVQVQSSAATPARKKIRVSRERARQISQETLENYRNFDMSGPVRYAAP
jgi:hypothetical protein